MSALRGVGISIPVLYEPERANAHLPAREGRLFCDRAAPRAFVFSATPR